MGMKKILRVWRLQLYSVGLYYTENLRLLTGFLIVFTNFLRVSF